MYVLLCMNECPSVLPRRCALHFFTLSVLFFNLNLTSVLFFWHQTQSPLSLCWAILWLDGRVSIMSPLTTPSQLRTILDLDIICTSANAFVGGILLYFYQLHHRTLKQLTNSGLDLTIPAPLYSKSINLLLSLLHTPSGLEFRRAHPPWVGYHWQPFFFPLSALCYIAFSTHFSSLLYASLSHRTQWTPLYSISISPLLLISSTYTFRTRFLSCIPFLGRIPSVSLSMRMSRRHFMTSPMQSNYDRMK
jgi:hypothetical protein